MQALDDVACNVVISRRATTTQVTVGDVRRIYLTKMALLCLCFVCRFIDLTKTNATVYDVQLVSRLYSVALGVKLIELTQHNIHQFIYMLLEGLVAIHTLTGTAWVDSFGKAPGSGCR